MSDPPPDEGAPRRYKDNPTADEISKIAEAANSYTRHRKRSDTKTDKHNRDIHWWARAGTIGAWVYTAFTAFILIANIRSIQETRRATFYASKAATAAIVQADTAQDSERRQLRAYVTAVASGGVDLDPSHIAHAAVQITFMGNSPAYDVEADIHAAVTGDPAKTRLVGGGITDSEWRSIVSPGSVEGDGLSVKVDKPIDAASSNLFAQGGPWVIWGRVDYSDVFGCYHLKLYCYIAYQNGKKEECPDRSQNDTEPRAVGIAECKTSKWP